MSKREMATIVSYCKDCGNRIEVSTDWSSDDGLWEKPKEGGTIGADTITSVREMPPLPNSVLPCYVVELDTIIVPHCEAAQRRKANAS